MYKLINANLFRLRKNIIFWLFIIISICTDAFIIFHYKSTIKLNETYINMVTLDEIINKFIVILGLFIAIFVSLFIGREYSDGIIRNKIVAGHSRTSIYLSNLATCVIVGIIVEIIHLAIILLVGTYIFGKLQMSVSKLILLIVSSTLIIVLYTSIYIFITMIFSEITISTVVCIFLFIAMYIISGSVSATVHATPYNTTSFIDEQGIEHVINMNTNFNYPSEVKVKFARAIYFSLPTGNALELDYKTFDKMNQVDSSIKLIPFYTSVSIIIVNVMGIYLFNKKELK